MTRCGRTGCSPSIRRACSAPSTRWWWRSSSAPSRPWRRCSPARTCRRLPTGDSTSGVPDDAIALRDVGVALRDVTYEYVTNGRVTRAVEDVSLAVARVPTVAFVGPSGCGKSTLLKLIAGLLPTTSGTITVDDRRVAGPLKNVGMAFQNPVLLPWRTVLHNLLLP